ncbi:hypothetical protein KPATCC21470_6928 [Kitasatospora purpeofusca]
MHSETEEDAPSLRRVRRIRSSRRRTGGERACRSSRDHDGVPGERSARRGGQHPSS